MLPLQPYNPRVALFSDLTNVHEIYHIQELQKCNQMKNDPRSCKRNLCNCERSLKKTQDFNEISRPQYSIKYSITKGYGERARYALHKFHVKDIHNKRDTVIRLRIARRSKRA